MENKNNIPNNPLEKAPFLSKIKKEHHFLVPKNYFEILPEKINDKKLNNKSLKVLFNKLSYRFLVPIPTLIVIFFVVFYFSNHNNTKIKLTNRQLSELVINENYIEIDDDLVYDAYAKILKEDAAKTSTTNDAYINYLIDNDIDINSIIATP